MIKKIRIDKLNEKNIGDLLITNPPEFIRLIDGLLEKQFTIADIDIDHRSVMHWEKEEILDKTNENKDRWRKYSFIDYVWLRLIMEMRAFGLPIPIIKKVKDELFQPVYEQLFNQITDDQVRKLVDILGEDTRISINRIKKLKQIPDKNFKDKISILTRFGAAVISIILSRAPTYLLLTKEGESGLAIMEEGNLSKTIDALLNQFESANTLVLNITKIINEFHAEEVFNGATYFNLTPLSGQEKEIIDIIRSGGVQNINIRLKGGNEFFVEVLRKKPAKNIIDQIQRIIAKNDYRRITLDTEAGKVVYINETEKIIIK